MINQNLVARFRFMTVVAVGLTVLLWSAAASAQQATSSQQGGSHSSGLSILLSNHFDLSGINWGHVETTGSVVPDGSSTHSTFFANSLQLIASRITSPLSDSWFHDGLSGVLEHYVRPPTGGGHTTPTNAIPEPQAALLFAIGVGASTLAQKRRA